jgi:hypothetical protein
LSVPQDRTPDTRKPGLSRYRQHVRWQLTAISPDHATALAVLHERSTAERMPGCHVGHNGSITLRKPTRNQGAKFHGRLLQEPHPAGGAMQVVSGVLVEPVVAMIWPLLYGFLTFLMLLTLAFGIATFTVPALLIGLVGTLAFGAMAVFFWRMRRSQFSNDAQELFIKLLTLLAPYRPEPLGGAPLRPLAP